MLNNSSINKSLYARFRPRFRMRVIKKTKVCFTRLSFLCQISLTSIKDPSIRTSKLSYSYK